MNKLKKSVLLLLILFLHFSDTPASVSIQQSMEIKEDGSGTLKLTYYTKSNNLSGVDQISTYTFNEAKAKELFFSPLTEIKDIHIYKSDKDSITYMIVQLNFKDLNKLSEVNGFKNITAGWTKAGDSINFVYEILKDSVLLKSKGAKDAKYDFSVVFPNKPLHASGKIDGSKVNYFATGNQLENDTYFRATLKAEGSEKSGKKCGLFSGEFPLIVFLGLLFKYKSRFKKRKDRTR